MRRGRELTLGAPVVVAQRRVDGIVGKRAHDGVCLVEDDLLDDFRC